jgi:hypothetical protein
MLRYEYFNVNIHNKGMIPLIGKIGPIFGMSMNIRMFERLYKMQGMIIFKADNDPVMDGRMQIQNGVLVNPASQQIQNSISTATVKPTSNKAGSPDKSSMDDMDRLIEQRLNEQGQNDESGDIKLSSGDLEEIKENTTSRVYTRYELGGFSKEKLKHILNVERKQRPGSKFYGAFHDRKPKLIEFVLATQDSVDEEKK